MLRLFKPAVLALVAIQSSLLTGTEAPRVPELTGKQ